MTGAITCQECGTTTPRRSYVQRFCEPCSSARHRARQLKWARANPPTKLQLRKKREAKKSRVKSQGAALSVDEAESIAWPASESPDLRWMVRVAVPFDYAFSKNATWRFTTRGHVFMREEARNHRNELASQIQRATAGQEIFEGKIWIDIYVQKPDHRGDAVNVIDTVCDAIKDAIPVDDNWYSIRRLDWQVVKTNPRLFVGIGQEVSEHHRVCSHCGRTLTLEHFRQRRGARLGRGRACKDCLRGAK